MGGQIISLFFQACIRCSMARRKSGIVAAWINHKQSIAMEASHCVPACGAGQRRTCAVVSDAVHLGHSSWL